jgi:hypothetical protein
MRADSRTPNGWLDDAVLNAARRWAERAVQAGCVPLPAPNAGAAILRIVTILERSKGVAP